MHKNLLKNSYGGGGENMLRLLIADDEKLDRESIISILQAELKEQLDISEARNGREAIEISEQIRPEIIIMDIKMPGINGLQAIQEIKKFLPNAYFIILTAYDYFDFAVEAVKNNVKEYLLKPFSRTELVDKIRDAVSRVQIEKDKRKSEIENQEKLYTLLPVLENELSYAIINDTLRSIDCDTYMRYLNLDFLKACSMIVKVKAKTEEDKTSENSNEDLKLQVGEFIKEYINRRYRAIASFRFTKELVYFIQMKDYENDEEVKLTTTNLAADIRREVKKIFDVSLKIGIGGCYSGLREMHTSYKEASSCLEQKIENIDILYFRDISTNYREKENNNDRGKLALFKEVEQYILDNIKEEFDLEMISAKFNLSPFYFSRIFKDVLGYNFSDYINVVRIRKAKELLKDDSESIKEICYTVGYSDPNYFSKVFKKYEGVTPTEYKNKVIKML